MNHADQQRNRIPDFASREEEAAFWEAHDITDYLNEFQVVIDVKWWSRKISRPASRCALLPKC